MILHYHPVSPYSRKAQVAVLHRGDAVALRMVDIRAGGLRTPEFLALSPFGKMPVLETPDGPLIESTSIIEYLEARGPALLVPAQHARVARHFDRLADHYILDPQSEIWFRPGSDAAKKAPEILAKVWRLFEHQLGDGRAFVCGDAFTLGDIGGAIGADYVEGLGLPLPPLIAAWRERCFHIEAMASALAEARPMVQAMLAARVVPAGA